MPPEPSVTSACAGPLSCTLRYSSALLPKSFERPGPKSVSPATYCSGVEVVVWWRWIVDMRAPYLCGVTAFIVSSSKTTMNNAEIRHPSQDGQILPDIWEWLHWSGEQRRQR